jgi:hypothetical protein
MAAHYAPVYRPREFTIRLRRGAESVWVDCRDVLSNQHVFGRS